MTDDLPITQVENAVLGAAMVDPSRTVEVAALVVDDFATQSARDIFEAIKSLHDDGKPVDERTVAHRLDDSSEHVTPETLAALAVKGAEVSEETFTGYLAIMAERRKLFEIADLARKVAAEALKPGAKPSAVFGEFWTKAKALDVSSVGGAQSLRAIIDGLGADIGKVLDPKSGAGAGMATGFIDLDDLLDGGLRAGELAIVAARPGVGKTALAINIAVNLAQAGRASLFYSLEMGTTPLLQRILCGRGGVDHSKLRAGELDEDARRKLRSAIHEIRDWPLWIDARPALSVEEAMAQARKMRQEIPLSLVVVDYLQLMTTSRARSTERREREVAIVSSSLKQLAGECECCVLALAQLNRAMEHRRGDERRPRLADLRESGSIEAEADVVISLYRPEMDNQKDASLYGKAELDILKQRSGRTGQVELLFEGEYVRFRNYDKYGRNEEDAPVDLSGGEELVDI